MVALSVNRAGAEGVHLNEGIGDVGVRFLALIKTDVEAG